MVKEHAPAWMARLSSKRRYAGVWRSLLQAEHPGFLTKAFWTKGHAWGRSSPEQWKAMSSQQRWEAMGNRAVDRKADAGREAHPQGDEAWQQNVRKLIKQVPMILRTVAAVWPLFPKVAPGLLRYKKG